MGIFFTLCVCCFLSSGELYPKRLAYLWVQIGREAGEGGD